MKKLKYSLVAVFMLITGVSKSQQINFSKKFLKSSAYANKAELAICKNDLKKAVLYYDSVFMTTKKPFSRDMFNYALCEKKLGNNAVADSLFRILYFENFKKKNLGACFDTARYYKQKQKVRARYGQIEKIEADILRTDQFADGARFDNMQMFLDTVVTNAKRIMKLVKYAELDSLELFSLDNSKLFFPIVHFFQLWQISNSKMPDRWKVFACLKNADFNKYGFDKFLIEQTKEGNFDPHTLAQLYSMLGVNMELRVVSQYNNKYLAVLYPYLFNKELLNNVNNNRKKFGLESYNDYFTKARYTDSLLNKGKPFQIVNIHDTAFSKLPHDFLLANGYRFSFGFHSDKSAFNAYQNQMKAIEQNNSK